MNLLTALMIAVLLLTGMGVALLGSIKLPLAARLGIDEVRVGGLVSLFGFIMIPVILTAGFLTDLLGRLSVVCGGSVLLALSLGFLALARNYSQALTATVLLSAGWSLLVNVGNVLTLHAFPGPVCNAVCLSLWPQPGDCAWSASPCSIRRRPDRYKPEGTWFEVDVNSAPEAG